MVDDELSIQRFVERVLTAAGHTTARAANASEALALWEAEGPFDVLLTDLMMPGMVGLELAQHLRVRARTIKVIYLTAFTLGSFATPPTLGPGDAYLEKPVSATDLQRAVADS